MLRARKTASGVGGGTSSRYCFTRSSSSIIGCSRWQGQARSQRRPSARQTRSHGADRYVEGERDVVVAEGGPREQQHDVALFGRKLQQQSRDLRSDIPVVIRRGPPMRRRQTGLAFEQS